MGVLLGCSELGGCVVDSVGASVVAHLEEINVTMSTLSLLLSCALCCQSTQVNQTFTIEPIFVEGSNRVKMWKDDWTATTVDGGLAVQCEHTVLITPNGAEVLTVA